MRRRQPFESTLGPAAGLIATGLVVQLLTCFRVDALAFVVFVTVGGFLTATGVLLFLYWLARQPRAQD